MRNYIIGTSGHIDHGKTSIIKSLTGIDTDRLKEEKEKGISIDIGFSYIDIDQNRFGIIDIPGHEKFIKNMLAGASSIDICLFIVAADDGIMPQTIEHFDILNLLNLKHGIIVLNKCDRVDKSTIEKRRQELREFCKESFLEDSLIIETSIYDENSINNLKSAINSTISLIKSQEEVANVFRMPIDRFFSLKGIGSVITGTTMGACVSVGDKLEILPQKTIVTVKNIQNHNQDMQTLSTNNRCALNINYSEKIAIKRGNVIATPNMLFSSDIIDVELKCLKNSKHTIKNGQRVRVYHLANESIARVKLMNCDELTQGNSCFAQIILEKPIIALNDDVVVIRNFSPLLTIGGGTIINVTAVSTKRYDENYLKNISKTSTSTDTQKVLEIIYENSSKFFTLDKLRPLLISIENYENILKKESTSQVIIVNDIYVHKRFLQELESEIITFLDEFHKNNPYKLGVDISILRQRFFSDTKNIIVKAILEKLDVEISSNNVKLKGFTIKLNKEEQIVKEIIIKNYKRNGYKLVKVETIKQTIKNKQAFDDVFSLLVKDGELLRMQDDLFILKIDFEKLVEFMKTLKKIELSYVRDYANTNRKSVIAILEYCDKNKITKRIDDYRIVI